MHVLLDTHVVLWAFADPDRLERSARAAIVDARNRVVVSAATVWEVEIKRALGKLAAPDGFGELCVERGFEALSISFEHARVAAGLPRHHADPFDRMIIGQALVTGATIMTADAVFDRYEGVRIVPALEEWVGGLA